MRSLSNILRDLGAVRHSCHFLSMFGLDIVDPIARRGYKKPKEILPLELNCTGGTLRLSICVLLQGNNISINEPNLTT